MNQPPNNGAAADRSAPHGRRRLCHLGWRVPAAERQAFGGHEVCSAMERRITVGLLDWLKGARKGKPPVESRPAQAARRTTAELLEQLWHVTDGREVKALVDNLSDEEAAALVASINVNDVPLNAFCTQAFNLNGLDDRMVAITFVALRLLEADRKGPLVPLLEKLMTKSSEKIRRGTSPSGPSFESSDPWRFGESLMMTTHTLALELLKRSHDRPAASLLQALLLDYPDRLESRFWLASARHNLYMQSKDAESRKLALQAIDSFLEAAGNRPDYRQHVEALQGMRSSEY